MQNKRTLRVDQQKPNPQLPRAVLLRDFMNHEFTEAAFDSMLARLNDWKSDNIIPCPVCGKWKMHDEGYGEGDDTCSLICHSEFQATKGE